MKASQRYRGMTDQWNLGAESRRCLEITPGGIPSKQLDVGRHATTVICIQYGLIDCRLAPNIGLEVATSDELRAVSNPYPLRRTAETLVV